jgi:DNA-binding phage protein
MAHIDPLLDRIQADESVPVDGTLMELASEIGLSHEVLYRTLAKLEKGGALSRTASAIVVSKIKGV